MFLAVKLCAVIGLALMAGGFADKAFSNVNATLLQSAQAGGW